MYEIHVTVEVRAPIDRVFDALSDHERLFRGRWFERCEVTRHGDAEKNGLGAIRQIRAGGSDFVEEVVRFERPRRFDYVVRSVTRRGRRLPLEHELGWLELSEVTGGTRVDWRSRFRIAVPLVGFLVERREGKRAAAIFEKLLLQAKAELERSAP